MERHRLHALAKYGFVVVFLAFRLLVFLERVHSDVKRNVGYGSSVRCVDHPTGHHWPKRLSNIRRIPDVPN